jgi:hypothetical protein
MDNIYGVVVAVILLFPWSLVALMIAGTLWGRVRESVPIRSRR